MKNHNSTHYSDALGNLHRATEAELSAYNAEAIRMKAWIAEYKEQLRSRPHLFNENEAQDFYEQGKSTLQASEITKRNEQNLSEGIGSDTSERY